jgi:hypothetical protein
MESSTILAIIIAAFDEYGSKSDEPRESAHPFAAKCQFIGGVSGLECREVSVGEPTAVIANYYDADRSGAALLEKGFGSHKLDRDNAVVPSGLLNGVD